MGMHPLGINKHESIKTTIALIRFREFQFSGPSFWYYGVTESS